MFAAASTARAAKTWLGQTQRAREPAALPSSDDEPPKPMEMRGPTGPGTNPWHSPATFDRDFDARRQAAARQDLDRNTNHSDPSPDEALRPYQQPQMQTSRRTSTSQTMAALAARDRQKRAAAARAGLDDIPTANVDSPPRSSRREQVSRYEDPRAAASVSPGRNPYTPSSSTSSSHRSPRSRRDPYGVSQSPYFNNEDRDGDLSNMAPVQPVDFTSSNQQYFPPTQDSPPRRDGRNFKPTQGNQTIEQGLQNGLANQDADMETETETNFLLWWKHLQKGLAELKEMKGRLEQGRRTMTNSDRFSLIQDMKATCDDLAPTVRQFRDLVKANITREKLAEIADKYNLVEPGRTSKLLHDIEGLRRQVQKITADVEKDFRAMQVAQLKQTSEENERAIGIMYDGKSQQEKEAARQQLDANPEGFIQQRVMNGERLNAANMTLSYAQERLRLWQETEVAVQLLADLTAAVAEKVECQDAQIVKIEEVTEQVEERVEGGIKHIDEGIVKGNKKRRKKWWCLLAALLTLAIIGGILAVYFLVIKKKGAGGGGSHETGTSGQESNTAATSGQTTVGYPATGQQNANANNVVARSVGNMVGKRWYG